MVKVFPLLAIMLLTLEGIDTNCRASAQNLPAKFKAVPISASVARAAATNDIPLAGIDSPLPTHILHPGDSATILGTMFLKRKETQWLLYLRAEAQGTIATNQPPMVVNMFKRKISFASKPVPASLRMLGPFNVSDDSKQLKSKDQTARFMLNESFLGIGLDRAAAIIWHRKQVTNAPPGYPLTPDEQQAFAGALPAINSYFDIVQHTDGLDELLLHLVKLPSAWSVIRHLGVTSVLEIMRTSAPANPADWDLPLNTPAFYVPCILQLNEQSVLKITLVVTAPNPPRLICGGVIAVLVERIGDNESYMILRVISAKCKSQE